MISMREVIDMLTDCELAQLVYVDSDSKTLNMRTLPGLIRTLNLGVLEMHKRFLLKTGTAEVLLDKERHRYYLRPAHRVGAKGDSPKYLISSDLLGPRSLLKVEQIFDQEGREYSLNTDPFYGLMTPAPDILEVSDHILLNSRANKLTVKFRMAPRAEILCDDLEEEDIENLKVDIPYTHLQALIWFVASRSHASKGFQENTASEFISYGNKFEAECAALDALNYRVDQQGGTDRLMRQGWA